MRSRGNANCPLPTAHCLELRPDLDAIEALSPEREALWARLDKATFLTADEKRSAVGYAPLDELQTLSRRRGAGRTRTEPLEEASLRALGLTNFRNKLEEEAGREVSLMIYSSRRDVTRRGPAGQYSGSEVRMTTYVL